jgi:hypothetical protein
MIIHNNAKDYFPNQIVATIILDDWKDSSRSNYKAWNCDCS